MNTKRQPISDNLRWEIFKRDGGACGYCGEPLTLRNYTMDHLTPVCRGGSNDPTNLMVACRSCNCSKGTRTYRELWCTMHKSTARRLGMIP